MTNEAHHEGRAYLGLFVGLLCRGHRANTRAQDSDAHRKSLCPTQDYVNLRWCQPRLGLAFTAISLPHLAAIERQVLLLVTDLNQNGLPIDPQPYVNFATALWDSASLVQDHHALITRPFRSLAFALAAGLRCAACAARDLCDLSLSLRDWKKMAQFNSIMGFGFRR